MDTNLTTSLVQESFTLWMILAACCGVIFTGLSKGGLTGVGSLGMPIMALAIDPVASAALMLPILITQDAIGVALYRKHVHWHLVWIAIPGILLGIAFGYLFADVYSSNAVLGVLGVITILFGLQRLIKELRNTSLPSEAPHWLGIIFGAASGFTSFIAHAGGPPYQMWILPKRLPKELLIGTTAITFAVINWVKVAPYAALGQFTEDSLTMSAYLIPLAIFSTYVGAKLVRLIDIDRYYRLIYSLMVLLGFKLVYDAFY